MSKVYRVSDKADAAQLGTCKRLSHGCTAASCATPFSAFGGFGASYTFKELESDSQANLVKKTSKEM